jgi:hypothetical protein
MAANSDGMVMTSPLVAPKWAFGLPPGGSRKPLTASPEALISWMIVWEMCGTEELSQLLPARAVC